MNRPVANPVTAYLRVSSRAQDAKSQLSAIERAAQARGDAVSSVYEEKRSGKTIDRPMLARLREDAKAGLIRRLYVFRLDRLTRSGIRDTLEVVEELRHHGVELVSVSDGFDLQGPAADIVLAVLAWASKMERLAVNERIAAARDRIESEGGRWGRPRRMDRSLIARARAMHSKGATTRAIAIALKIPRTTITRAVKGAKG